MINGIFGETMENLRKSRNIKLVTIENRTNNLVTEPNYHIMKFFTETLLSKELKKKSNIHEQTCVFRTASNRA